MTTFLVIIVVWAGGKVTTSTTPYPTQEACSAIHATVPDKATNVVAICVPSEGPE